MPEANLLLAGKAKTTDPTFVDGVANPLSLTTTGRLRSDVTGTVAVSGGVAVTGAVSVTGAVTVSGTATVSGAVTVSGTATTTPTTPTPYTLTTAASTNTGFVKASAGSLFELTVFNSSGATVYVKIYNKASAPTLASDVPVFVIPVAAAAFTVANFGQLGKRFATGIAIAVTGAAGFTDTTNIAANVLVSATYL